MKRNNTNIILAVGLVLMAAAARILNREMSMPNNENIIHTIFPSLFNLAPVGALGLFCGSVFKDKRVAFLMPLLAMFIADIYFQFFTNVHGFYGLEQWFVYGGLVLATLLGTFLKRRNPLNIVGFSLVGSLIFFIVSNFGSYLSGMWGQGSDALLTTYIRAIPFFRNTVISDLIWSSVLFGIYFLVQRSPEAKAQKA